MSYRKKLITFKTFSDHPIHPSPAPIPGTAAVYPLTMLRSVLMLNGIYQLVPASTHFHDFVHQAIDSQKIKMEGTFSFLLNQILEFYHFDRQILNLTQGFTRMSEQEFWFDKLKDPQTGQNVIFLKSPHVDGSEAVLQIAYLEPDIGSILSIYQLLKSLRQPRVNLQEIVDAIAANQQLVSSLTRFAQKLTHHSKDEVGVMEVFLLLGQDKFKEWWFSEIVANSADLVPPEAEQFHYPVFQYPKMPGSELINGPGLVEAFYILGFLALQDEISHTNP